MFFCLFITVVRQFQDLYTLSDTYEMTMYLLSCGAAFSIISYLHKQIDEKEEKRIESLRRRDDQYIGRKSKRNR